MSGQEHRVLLLIYGANGLQDLRFTNIYTATHKIYSLMRTPQVLGNVASYICTHCASVKYTCMQVASYAKRADKS